MPWRNPKGLFYLLKQVLTSLLYQDFGRARRSLDDPKLVEKTLQEFPHQTELRVLDILYCEGGCINGAGVITKGSLDGRRQKIITYWNRR